MTALYHTEVEFPSRVVLPSSMLLESDARGHTESEAKENYDYVPFEIPEGILIRGTNKVFLLYREEDGSKDLREGHIFEIESNNGKITKIVVRCHYDIFFDIVVAINMRGVEMEGDSTPTTNTKTAYLNPKSDQHDTLDKSRYDIPNETVVTV